MMKTYSKKPINEKPDSVIASTYGAPFPTNNDTATRLAQIDDMKYFFVSATQQWEHNRPLKRFSLPNGESIACVFYDDLFFITGTDIVRSLTFRFHAFGRPVINAKKFEEGIFSDLRNLKPGHDARLEEPKSELLDMLYKNNCIRTQKKQKVFFWFSVPHDRLFLDALERDLKREKMGFEPTTKAVAEPASSISLDSTQELFDQLRKNVSQSAAATAESMEQDILSPIPITSLSLNSATTINTNQVADHSFLEEENQDWTSPDWTTFQSKRPRVNSVPSSLGQKQQLQLLQQKQNRLSHGSYFSGSSYRSSRLSSSSSSMLASPEDLYFRDDTTTTSTSTPTLADIARSTVSTPLNNHKYHPSNDYMDPIANGVHHLDISASVSNTSTTTTSNHLLHQNSSNNNVLPSKSLDSNTLKKTKTIFGNLSLFDGSPTYKLRRRRASSVSTSLLNMHPRNHSKNRTLPSSTAANGNATAATHHQSPATSNTSRLAMAAVKAGFAPTLLQPVPPFPTQDYYCPVTDCRHLFKRLEHLERHMQALHTFTCTVCGKQFVKSEKLVQHHRLEHQQVYDTRGPSLNYGDHDDDSSYDGGHHPQWMSTATRQYPTQQQQQQVLSYSTEQQHVLDGSSRSSWCAPTYSRSSTLSPMSDSNKLLYSFYSEPSSLSPSPEPMTLLSPFKLQQLPFDFDMALMNDYVPYVDQHYNPYSSPDNMNIVFEA